MIRDGYLMYMTDRETDDDRWQCLMSITHGQRINDTNKRDKNYQQQQVNLLVTRTSLCDYKLARLLFNFDVINATDDDDKQQVPSIALRLQLLITPAGRQLSCSVYNNCGLTPTQTGDY